MNDQQLALLVAGSGLSLATSMLTAIVTLSDPIDVPEPTDVPERAPREPPPPVCTKWRIPDRKELPSAVVRRAYQLLPQKNGFQIVEWWSGKWWRFTRAVHGADSGIPWAHPGTNVEVCA